MRVLAPLGLALLAGCASSLELADLDRLERSIDARTVALEADYTLWSPFALEQTRTWVDMVDEELAASRALFGTRHEGRLLLALVPVEGLGPQVEVGAGQVAVAPQRAHPLHGLAGAAGGAEVVVYVTPDRVLQGPSGPLVAHRAAGDYRGTLRHELAHVHADVVGLEGPKWLSEGVADLVESYVLEEGRLVDRGPEASSLLRAGALRGEQLGVARLLDWREDGIRIAAGEEQVDEASRILCGLFMRFLVDRQPPGSLVERLAGVQALSRAELEELEPAWRGWLQEAIQGA
jgi:hypothetical protein